MPGLVDTHSHVGGGWGGDGSGPIQPDVRILDSINVRDSGFRKCRAGGLTTLNIMPGSGHLLSGQTVYVKLRRAYDDRRPPLPRRRRQAARRHEDGQRHELAEGRRPSRARGRNRRPSCGRSSSRPRTTGEKVAEAEGDPDKRPTATWRWRRLVDVLDGRDVVHHHCPPRRRHHHGAPAPRRVRLQGGAAPRQRGLEGGRPRSPRRALGCSVIVVDSPGGQDRGHGHVAGHGRRAREGGRALRDPHRRSRHRFPALPADGGPRRARGHVAGEGPGGADARRGEDARARRPDRLARRRQGRRPRSCSRATRSARGRRCCRPGSRGGRCSTATTPRTGCSPWAATAPAATKRPMPAAPTPASRRRSDERRRHGSPVPSAHRRRPRRGAAGLHATAPAAAPADQPLAMRGDTVYTMAGPPIADGVVLIARWQDHARRPAATTSRFPPPPRCCAAKVVTPGLVDAHSVVGLAGFLNQEQDQDQLDKGEPIQPELRAIDSYNPRERLDRVAAGLRRHDDPHRPRPGGLVSGQTMVVKTVGDDGRRGRDSARWRWWPSRSATTARPGGDGAEKKSPGTRSKAVAMLRGRAGEGAGVSPQARTRRRDEAARHATCASRPSPDVLAGTVPLLVTADRAHDIASALRIAKEFGLRIVLDSAAEAYLVADRIKAAGVPVIVHPTMRRAGGGRDGKHQLRDRGDARTAGHPDRPPERLRGLRAQDPRGALRGGHRRRQRPLDGTGAGRDHDRRGARSSASPTASVRSSRARTATWRSSTATRSSTRPTARASSSTAAS